MATPVKNFRTKEESRDPCRKWKRKMGRGTKAELEERNLAICDLTPQVFDEFAEPPPCVEAGWPLS